MTLQFFAVISICHSSRNAPLFVTLRHPALLESRDVNVRDGAVQLLSGQLLPSWLFWSRWRKTIKSYSYPLSPRTLSGRRVGNASPVPRLAWTRSQRLLPCHRSYSQFQARQVLSRYKYHERSFSNKIGEVWEITSTMPPAVHLPFQYYLHAK